MLDSPDLPEKDKSTTRLASEGRVFVGAGTETMGNMLSLTTFYLLSSPEKAMRVKEEISEAKRKRTGPLNTQDLQRLPYLNAVVLEGLRISTSVAGRLPRVNTHEVMVYKTYTIPVGTPVSTTQKHTHDDPTIYTSPREFLPERWLVALEKRKVLEKYLQPFGKGSRSCIGIHLAYAEIYKTLAEMFSNFELELFETDEDDIKQVHDFFSPYPTSTRGLRVLVS